MQNKVIRFFEMPVNDLNRATHFYESVFKTQLQTMEMDNLKMAMFCADADQTHGALIQATGYQPSQQGTLVYFDGGDDMQALMDRIPDFGGKVTMNKTVLEGHGYIGKFIDTEGNKIALHSES